jgi:hypothetical protein
MKAMTKAELELEKLISKLEGQLASAHYALGLLRKNEAEATERTASPAGERSTRAIMARSGHEIPLFS